MADRHNGADSGLTDSYGRVHTDLRVSLTDRCSLRCTYCMPEQGLAWLPRDEVLTTDELLRLVRIAVDQGVRSVRLTGGEPLLRPDVVDVVAGIAALPQPPQIALTTNGLRLPELAQALAAAGLQRVNVSLDTVDRATYLTLTKRDHLDRVLAGIAAAQEARLDPVKVNAVLLRGRNDHQASDLLAWAMKARVHLRFIEQMPLDPQHGWDRADMVTGAEILARLQAAGHTLEPVARRGSAPAQTWLVDGGPESVGLVASVTSPFCGDCNRLRLTADGQWRTCLFALHETDLRGALRSGADDAALARLMGSAVRAKLPGHGINDPQFLQPTRPMSAIGG